MNLNKKTKIYLFCNNHSGTIGIQQQIDVIERVFDKLPEFELIRSQLLMRNQINLLIEENNQEFAKRMKQIKTQHPDTKFLLFVTEYLTKSFFGYQLNSFDYKTKLTHAYIDFLSQFRLMNLFSMKCFDERIQKKFTYGKILNIVKEYLNLIFLAPLRLFHDRDSLTNAIQITRREHYLKKTKSFYNLVFSNHEAVNKTYNNFFKSNVILLPTFINKRKAKHARYNMGKKYKKHYFNSLFFSGRLTSYRKKVMRKLFKLNNGYHGFPYIRYVERIDHLLNDKNDHVPLFEIYIKQEKNWLYSSPMRTLMSIEKGYYPIDFGSFRDNDINKLSIKLFPDSNLDEILDLFTKKTTEEYFKILDEKIDQHNNEQEVLLENIKRGLNNLLV